MFLNDLNKPLETTPARIARTHKGTMTTLSLIVFVLRHPSGTPILQEASLCDSWYLLSDSLTWKWKMTPWKTTFLYKQEVFHFHVSQSECTPGSSPNRSPWAPAGQASVLGHRDADATVAREPSASGTGSAVSLRGHPTRNPRMNQHISYTSWNHQGSWWHHPLVEESHPVVAVPCT